MMANMGNNPDWIFYRHGGPTEAEVMPRLVAEFPGFRPRWEKHLEYWEGKPPAGNYNDIAQFAHFVLKDLFLDGKNDEVQRAFDLMEYWLKDGSKSLQELIVIGFFEDVQNLALGQGLALDSFVTFLGPKSREAWDELEKFWAGKGHAR
jgi:hypothetical protein